MISFLLIGVLILILYIVVTTKKEKYKHDFE